MSFTVVPLHNLNLPAGSRIPFGSKFVLQDMPKWLKEDKEALSLASFHDRNASLLARHAFVAEYEADSDEFPDPEWRGKTPKSIQNLRWQSAMLANMSIWCIQPSSVCFTVGFHALTTIHGTDISDEPLVIGCPREGPLYCHPQDAARPVWPEHVIEAAKLFETLSLVPRKNPVWEALRAFWAGLTMYPPDLRYPFFWMGLEALFGAKDGAEIGYKLAQRIAFFLAENPTDARDLFRKVKTCYGMRSKIVHGRWEDDPKIEAVMADSEAIVRTVVRRLAENQEMLNTFISNKRDAFLEDWVFSRSTDPPPFRA